MDNNNMIEEHSLTVEYSLTRREIFRSFLYSVAQSPKYRGTILLYSVAIGVLTLLIRTTVSRSLTVKDAISAVAWAMAFLVFIPIWTFVRGKTAKRIITVSKYGISTEIGRLRSRVSWDRVRVVADTPQFVLIARINGSAFFVPHRAFSGPEGQDHFVREIRGWMHAGTKISVKCL
jgi:hypothetical protein